MTSGGVKVSSSLNESNSLIAALALIIDARCFPPSVFPSSRPPFSLSFSSLLFFSFFFCSRRRSFPPSQSRSTLRFGRLVARESVITRDSYGAVRREASLIKVPADFTRLGRNNAIRESRNDFVEQFPPGSLTSLPIGKTYDTVSSLRRFDRSGARHARRTIGDTGYKFVQERPGRV